MTYTATVKVPHAGGLLPADMREIARQLSMLAEHLSSCADEYSVCGDNLPDGGINYEDPDTGSVVIAAAS